MLALVSACSVSTGSDDNASVYNPDAAVCQAAVAPINDYVDSGSDAADAADAGAADASHD